MGAQARGQPQEQKATEAPTRLDNLYLFDQQCFIYTAVTPPPQMITPFSGNLVLSACGKPFRVDLGGESVWSRGIALPPLLARRVLANQAELVGFYVQPESRLYPFFAQLRAARRYQLVDYSSCLALRDDLTRLYQGHAGREEALRAYDWLCSFTTPEDKPGDMPDPARIALEKLLLRLGQCPETSLAELAEEQGRSYAWMSRMFAQRVGLSLREYKTWLKLRRAMEMLHSGLSLTEVAFQAGFADSAHLSREYRRAYGVPPSSSRKRKNLQFFHLQDD
ncbi:MAG: helix-turn-helix domain-containing protein [Pseudomonas sp.]